MEFKERYLPFPTFDYNDATGEYDQSETFINPLKISSFQKSNITWMNPKNKPVYSEVIVVVADGHKYYIESELDAFMIACNLFFS